MCTCRSVCACMCVFFVDERFISELHKLAPVFEIATRLKSVFDAFSFPSGNPQQKIQPAVETPFNNYPTASTVRPLLHIGSAFMYPTLEEAVGSRSRIPLKVEGPDSNKVTRLTPEASLEMELYDMGPPRTG